MNKPMVELKGLKKRYGNKLAVENLDLTIPEGELFVLVGPNGAGKTTTLKMLVGLLKPTEGSVAIGGYSLDKDPVHAKALISFVPDTPYVYEKLTPWELLRFVGKLYHMGPEAIKKRGAELLEFVSLTHVQNVLIEEFSHGMRQKVILAASLLHSPKLFVLDEPLVGLDPTAIKTFKDFLQQKDRHGMTIVFSTHTLSMAEELADRIAIVSRGKIIALGSMAELRETYQSTEDLENMFMTLVQEEMKPEE